MSPVTTQVGEYISMWGHIFGIATENYSFSYGISESTSIDSSVQGTTNIREPESPHLIDRY
jgi:hypothetical protein